MSHILNNHQSKFSPETETKVLNALETLNYRPSMAGRSLVNGRSDVVVVVLPNATFGLRMQDALNEIEAHAVELGVSVLTRFAGPVDRSTMEALHYVSPLAVMDMGGLTAHQRRELETAGTAVIPSSDRVTTHERSDPDSIVGDVQVQALARTKNRIAFAFLDDARIVGPFARARSAAVTNACLSRGLPIPEIIGVELTLEGASRALDPLLSEGPIGIACYNDDVATAVVASAAALGRSVPGDVAVVGVDVTPLGQMLTPPLTSVQVNIPAAMDASIQELRRLLGKPLSDAVDPPVDYVHVHQGGTT
ncbi:LacI family DNA-binding transcriptional regulator [Rhodococcus fascians]|nr:LacI family DNA-binding transcriptional regulator [Rhodococcus fascians]MBY4140523.1 LacI family DNA-binding transcriptional regulator [Rhodococcus fascians]MBY4219009.1 LacI family DNA-binding transcriptional regulator [Rhodococcus fascians]MBY4221961.1 LacI family DNA-binding transcriptional regulator [Rhodococcus fascians]MBY4233962.1 LacI family DNA-binding transcriptional regulator [Rhodococcus fascians]